MNISLQNIDKVSALLTVQIEKADYEGEVEKSLKNIRKKANIPGFRPGQVPAGLIKKQYGKAVLAEEVNKLLQDKIYEYLRDNKVNMLGEPLPNEEKQQPEADTIDYYTIQVDDEMVERQIKSYTQRNGKYEKADSYQDRDMLKGLLAELDEADNTKEGGLQVENATLMPIYMADEEQKAIFANAKVNDVLVFNPNAAFKGNEAELSSLLKIKKEEVAAHTGNFSFQIIEITRYVDGELNQEIFDQVFGKDAVKTEEEFRTKVREMLAANLVADSDYRFLVDARNYLANKIGKLEFPDALLKRIMLHNNEDKGEAFVAENYDKSIEELTWHLIKEQLVQANGIKVEKDDIEKMAKEVTRIQFAQYGMLNVPDDLLANYAQEMMKKQDSVNNLVNRVIEAKLTVALKKQVTLNNKSVTLDEFNKLFA